MSPLEVIVYIYIYPCRGALTCLGYLVAKGDFLEAVLTKYDISYYNVQ